MFPENTFQPPPARPSRRHMFSFFEITIIVSIVITLGIILYFRVISPPITSQQIAQAEDATSYLQQDSRDTLVALSSASDANTAAFVNDYTQQANAKLSDAQKQVNILEKSPVQRNGTVKKSFIAFQAKWGPWSTELQNSAHDIQVSSPVQIQLDNNYHASKTAFKYTAAQLTAYIPKQLQQVASYEQQIKTIHPKLAYYQQILSAQQTYLQSTSKDWSTAESQLSSGVPVLTVEKNLQANITTTVATVDSTINTLGNQFEKTQNQLYGGYALFKFNDSLLQLRSRTH
jgi:hypothetical protein